MNCLKEAKTGFTLIELSIVLVIIGLIVGGVLVGRDLIGAAGVRAQITQIEKYQTAVNTFKGKYNNYLPGDIPEPDASRFGFSPRGSFVGQGDGNAIISSNWNNTLAGVCGACEYSGETTVFWTDLSSANGMNVNLIEGNFNTASLTAVVSSLPRTSIGRYLPEAKIGNGNYVYAYSNEGGAYDTATNYLAISAVTGVGACPGCMASAPGLTVQQAYNIDKKIDDGLPQLGKVITQYLNTIAGQGGIWAVSGNTTGPTPPYTTATAASSTTCFDNNNVSGANQQYSITQNNGAGVNCALSFKFQ